MIAPIVAATATKAEMIAPVVAATATNAEMIAPVAAAVAVAAAAKNAEMLVLVASVAAGTSAEIIAPVAAAAKNVEMKQIILSTVSFPFNSVEISTKQMSEVKKIVKLLNYNPNMILNIIGFACKIGSTEANFQVSKMRAEIFSASLVKQGIDVSRIKTIIAEVDTTFEGKGELMRRAEVIPLYLEKEILLSTIYFEFNSIAISSTLNNTINEVAELLNNNPDCNVNINGYSDKYGSIKVNLRVSKMRAEVLSAILIKQDINASRIKTTGYGIDKTAISNNMARRIDIILTPPLSTLEKGG